MKDFRAIMKDYEQVEGNKNVIANEVAMPSSGGFMTSNPRMTIAQMCDSMMDLVSSLDTNSPLLVECEDKAKAIKFAESIYKSLTVFKKMIKA